MRPPHAPIHASTEKSFDGCAFGGRLAGDVGAEEVREAARALVRDSTTARQVSRAYSVIGPAELWSVWRNHLAVLAGAQHTILDPVRLARISSLAQRYLAGRAALFEVRRTGGPASRAEPLADLGRLAVDLEFDGDSQRVTELFDAYRDFSGDVFPASLAHQYVALAATSRASQAISASDANLAMAASGAGELIRLAVRHLDLARVHLVVIGGEPGTGKSTLASKLADACGWMLVSSVQVQADEPGASIPLGLRADWTSGRHDPVLTKAAYEEMLRRSRLLLERGQSVVLDATWPKRWMRVRAAAVADAAFADLVAMRCDAGETLRDARIRDRIAAGPAIADAALSICRRIAADFEPWPAATIVDTRQPIYRSLSTALRAIGTQVPSVPAPALEEVAAR